MLPSGDVDPRCENGHESFGEVFLAYAEFSEVADSLTEGRIVDAQSFLGYHPNTGRSSRSDAWGPIGVMNRGEERSLL